MSSQESMEEFHIEISEGLNISSNLAEEEISSIPSVHSRDIGNGCTWYWLPVTDIDDLQIVFGVCFFNGVLKDISISLSNVELYGGSWDDFSKSKEELRAKDTEKWLSNRGYKTGSYSWGSVWAGYDGKGGFGHAVVRYNS